MSILRLLPALLLAAGLARPCAAEDGAPIKSESRALQYSLFGTAVPVAAGALLARSEGGGGDALVLGGLVVGPSLGHWYAGRPGRAAFGIGVRSAAVVGLAVAVAGSWDNESSGSAALGAGCLVVGAFSVLADIVEAPKSARIRNSRRREMRICVAPLLGPSRGMAIRAAF